MDNVAAQILQRRMHGLYLTRQCEDIVQLSQELLGMHCWFHRNVAFSAVIRGAPLTGWKHALVKTWIYHALHGVAPEDLPTLLALHAGGWRWEERYHEVADRVISLMEDGVYSRAEMRLIFADYYDRQTIRHALSPWGGILQELARLGKVAFRDMTSRDFDLIAAEPSESFEEVLPGLFYRFIRSYGPATLADAARFFGLQREKRRELFSLDLEEFSRLEYNKNLYYYLEDNTTIGDIPELALLSGFDPLIVSYTDRSLVLPAEYKKAVIMSSGICLPTIAVHGRIVGLWNIKKGEPVTEFFSPQPKHIRDTAFEMVDHIYWRTRGQI